MESLRLRRPLAVLDLETTGTSPASDRIIEIAVLKLHPDGREEFRYRRVNPGVPIPSQATAVHGITDEDVADERPFRAYARGLNDFLADCDFAGYNIVRFDLPLLQEEFRRAGIEFAWKERAIVDVLAIFRKKEKSTLAAAVKFYCDRDFTEAHSADGDVRATVEVLRAQLARYDDLPRDVEALHQLCNPTSSAWIDPEGKLILAGGVATVAFGKHRGTPLSQLATTAPDYLTWILNGDFSTQVKDIVRNTLAGVSATQGPSTGSG